MPPSISCWLPSFSAAVDLVSRLRLPSTPLSGAARESSSLRWLTSLVLLSLCLSLSVCVCPGKVHGSLARAGKVKGQTPKVEKTEKHKKPRGRAYKKILYNRRFVNVIVTPGGKKGGYNSLAMQNAAKGIPPPTS
jgi:small subunit ribosomal protein S30e